MMHMAKQKGHLRLRVMSHTGAAYDSETGLYYLSSRYYEPETGRFINEDSYDGGEDSFWHLYSYCNSDPINNTNLTGHERGRYFLS